MATISKFYLHNAVSTVAGTLPGALSQAATTPAVTASGASTNRTMDATIGTLQVSATLTTLAQTALQTNWWRRFVSPPLAAQTIASSAIQAWTFSWAESESNTNSNFGFAGCAAYIWRPSSGVKVGNLWDESNGSGGDVGTIPASTSQTAISGGIPQNGATTSQTCIDGDVLIFEAWAANTQGKATAYTNTFFYDGTTEASATSCASFLTPPAALPLLLPVPDVGMALTVT